MKYPRKLKETNVHGKYNSHLVRSTLAEPPETNIACHSTANFVFFGFEEISEDGSSTGRWTEDQRYAIKVGDSVFNADHSLSILGQQFELDGKLFSIPFSSGSTAAIYVDDYVDDTPVRVRFIPSPNPEYNGIYAVNQGYQQNDLDVEYVDKDTEFSVCLKPEKVDRAFTCEGATDEVSIRFDNGALVPQPLYFGMGLKNFKFVYLGPNNTARSLVDERYDDTIGELVKEWIVAKLVNNVLTITYESTHPSGTRRLELHSLSEFIDAGDVSILEESNPTAFYSDKDKTIKFCLNDKMAMPEGTYVMTMSIQNDYVNYNNVLYDIYIDGVNKGSYQLTELSGTVSLGDGVTEVYIDGYANSSGNLELYFGTLYGGASFIVDLKPTDTTNNNIYGVSTDTNPSITYNSQDRSVKAAIVTSART